MFPVVPRDPVALLLAVCVSASVATAAEWNEVEFGSKNILLHPQCRPIHGLPLGPFATLSDGSVLAVDRSRVLVSTDEGKTWTARPLFAEPEKFQCRDERALLMTREGTLVLAFLNQKEMAFRWDQANGGPQPGCRLPAYITRSTDDGHTWTAPELLQDGYCGALRTMIQLDDGRLVLGCQQARANPGRHVCFTHVSDDDGRTWKQSNVIDLGDYGGYGDHGGGIEPTLVQLHDGRLWTLIRTYRGRFTQAISDDGGLTWKQIEPSPIESSGAPGQLARLQSGRIVLLWNRFIDAEKRTGRREQLSLAFSEDEAQSWTEPVVIAYDPKKAGNRQSQHRLSYPYVYERVPGELWITTMQGPLRIKLFEDDFLPRRLSDKTYRARWLPEADIELDGRADEPAWAKAAVAADFVFPWKDRPAPETEFRAVCDASVLWFTFRIEDDDIVVLDSLRDEEDAVFEDRAELYFAPGDTMEDYYCVEIDSRGRHFDYHGKYYRRLDTSWDWPGLETAASPIDGGYVVEGRIPLESFVKLGFPRLRPGATIRFGAYRAEFSHDRSGRKVQQRETIHNRGRKLDGPPPIEAWMSWVDPKTEQPDFHVPTSLGWLEVVE